MRVIIQKFTRSTVLEEEFCEPGLVLFVSSGKAISEATALKAASKIIRLRLWNQWATSIMDGSKRVIVVPIDGCECTPFDTALARLGYLVKVHHTSGPISFVNDGPCTMILNCEDS